MLELSDTGTYLVHITTDPLHDADEDMWVVGAVVLKDGKTMDTYLFYDDEETAFESCRYFKAHFKILEID